MSSILPPVPIKVNPIEETSGQLHQIWADWFVRLFQRVGGGNALTNDELNESLIGTDRIEDFAITPSKIDATVAGAGLAWSPVNGLEASVDSDSIEINADVMRVKNSGINFLKLLSTDWTANKAASGYQKLGSGVYVQWGVTGSINSGTNASQSFPTAFPTACLQVMSGLQGNSAGSTAATGHWGTGNYSTTGFDLYNRTSADYVFNWIAVGY